MILLSYQNNLHKYQMDIDQHIISKYHPYKYKLRYYTTEHIILWNDQHNILLNILGLVHMILSDHL